MAAKVTDHRLAPPLTGADEDPEAQLVETAAELEGEDELDKESLEA